MARRNDDVPRLPRGKGFSLSMSQIVRIVAVATALIALLVLQRPCSRAVSKFVTGFGPQDAGVPSTDAAPVVLPNGIRLRADMTPAEMEDAIRRAKALAASQAANAIDAGTASDAGAADAVATPDAR